MKQQSGDEIELRRYLLGELTPEERVAIEERLFLDEKYFQLLKVAEDELVDDYVYGELSADEHERTEAHFLNQPGRRDDLSFAKALRRYVSSEAVPTGEPLIPAGGDTRSPVPSRRFPFLSSLFVRRPVVGFSLAAALLIVLVGLIWVVVERAGRRELPRPGQAQGPRPEQGELSERRSDTTGNTRTNGNAPGEGAQLNGGQGNAPPVSGEEGTQITGQKTRRPPQTRGTSPQDEGESGRTLALLLPPGGVVRESGETNNLKLSSDVSAVILQLALVEREDYRSYRASLLSGERAIYERAGLKATPVGSVKVVPLWVPARLLRQQNYQVKLSGLTTDGKTQEIASYSFRVSER